MQSISTMVSPMNQQAQEPTKSKKLLSAASLVLFAAGAAILRSSNQHLSATSPPEIMNANEATGNRALSLTLPNGGCKVTYARLSPQPIPPTWQASYPGSGSRMTWSLVEALTGIKTTDDYDSHDRGYERVVAVKTHYPVKSARGRFDDLDPLFKRAMVVLRNPINAIPSYFNLQYEHQHSLPNHSTRGPNEDWIKYRDSVFSLHLREFEKFVSYWVEKYPSRNDLLLVTYEDLTDDDLGPFVATRITGFLAESEGIDPIEPEFISCIWHAVVKYKADTPVNEPVTIRRRLNMDPSSLRSGPKVRPYTEENFKEMVSVFQGLLDKYYYDAELVRFMNSYIQTVLNWEVVG